MFQILRTAKFDHWLSGLEDRVGQKLIAARLDRLAQGHWGDKQNGGRRRNRTADSFWSGLPCLLLARGCRSGSGAVVVPLGGGDKSSQASDIAAAKAMAVILKE